MKIDKRIWLVFLIPLGFSLIGSFFQKVYGSTTSLVGATVQISVCGNGIIEGGEDCETAVSLTQTCVGLGYAGGTLTCDISCSYDTTGCLAATPTPTPTSTPTSTSAPVATSTPAPVATATPAPVATATPVPATPTPVTAPAIPLVVAVFDTDGSGRIEVGEVLSVVKSWVDEWRVVLQEEVALAKGEAIVPRKLKKCDINRDGRCNLFDLSILLYYIER